MAFSEMLDRKSVKRCCFCLLRVAVERRGLSRVYLLSWYLVSPSQASFKYASLAVSCKGGKIRERMRRTLETMLCTHRYGILLALHTILMAGKLSSSANIKTPASYVHAVPPCAVA